MKSLNEIVRPSERRRRPTPKPKAPPAVKREENTELLAQRDRLLEKFTIMQADLGGAFYEMAIRDHVRLDVLTRKAAELQRVDAELLAVERVLELERADAAGLCPAAAPPTATRCAFALNAGTPLFRPRQGRERGAGAAISRAVAAAATLTGRRFGMLVASSLVATSAIVASAITKPERRAPRGAPRPQPRLQYDPTVEPRHPGAAPSSSPSTPAPSSHGARTPPAARPPPPRRSKARTKKNPK